MGIHRTDYNKLPKDLGGSIAQNRFKFQRYWAIKKIYELYEKGDEFIVIFDSVSDIDISINEELYFYQVKTDKNKKFTINRLIVTKDKNKHSILSKLGTLENYKGVKGLSIVSNNYLAEKDKNGQEPAILCLDDLKDKIKNKIKSHIQEKTEITADLTKYFYIKSDLNLESTYETLLGHTVKFLEKNFSTNETRAKLFLEWLISATEAKSSYENKTINVDDIIKNKGITKKQFSDLLDNYNSTNNKMLKHVTTIIDENYNIYDSPKLLRSLKEITESGLDSMRYKNSLNDIRQYILENKAILSIMDNKYIIEEISEKVAFDSSYDQYDKKCLTIIGFVQFKEKG